MREGPYKQVISGDPKDKRCVGGPGVGFGYHSHTMWPERQFMTPAEAETVTSMCNEAYQEGYKQAQYDIKRSLGIGE